MAEISAIEWCDSTFNPWIGCTKISPACDHCYAEALMDTRHHRVTWGGDRSRTGAANWQEPRRWQRQAPTFRAKHGRRQRVFCSSLADVFDNQVPDEWRADLWALIADTPDLDWLLLTKRPQNIGKMLPAYWDEVKGHVWLGTTVEDQKRADLNIPHLLQHDCAVPFISAEPLLSALDLWRYLDPLHLFRHRLGWVIAGGESGPQARPSHPDWFRSLRDQCAAAGVPFLFKQWGEWAPHVGAVDGWALADNPEQSRFDHLEWEGGAWGGPFRPAWCDWDSLDETQVVSRIGKKRSGRRLDGVEHNGFPQVRP